MKKLIFSLFLLFTSARGFSISLTIFHAANIQCLEGVICLVQAGEDLDATDAAGLTATHRAAIVGSVPTVDYLLRHGAHLGRLTILRQNLLHIAANHGHLHLVKYLSRFIESPRFPLNPASGDIMGNTPLHLAARAGHHAIAVYLANLDPYGLWRENGDEHTPYQVAVDADQTELVKAFDELMLSAPGMADVGRDPFSQTDKVRRYRHDDPLVVESVDSADDGN